MIPFLPALIEYVQREISTLCGDTCRVRDLTLRNVLGGDILHGDALVGVPDSTFYLKNSSFSSTKFFLSSSRIIFFAF